MARLGRDYSIYVMGRNAKRMDSLFEKYYHEDGFVQKDVDEYLSNIKDERIHINRRYENKGLAYSLNELLKIVMPMGYE